MTERRPENVAATQATGAGATALGVPKHDAIELAPGVMVGEYRIVGKLGAGGMGAVYSAEHPVIAKKAAIKVLHRDLSVDSDSVQRFIQEARSVNQIGHPNIVDIFSFGVLPDGRQYFVMEWLRGMSLRDRTRRERIPLADALAILETITLPLQAAHDVGIVHRDLKPDNVFLVDMKTEQPRVVLLDFGIAKLLGTQGMQQTQTGNMMGTPAYISPEQARAESVDHRTDIYALGAMAFELVTDRLAFDASTAVDMIAQHLYQPPRSARTFNPAVPPALDALLVRMLAKEPAARPTLDEVRRELHAIRMSLDASSFVAPPRIMPMSPLTAARLAPTVPPTIPPAMPTSAAIGTATPARSRSRIVIALVALVVLVAGAAAAFFALRGNDTPTASEAPPAPVVEPAPKPAVTEPAKPLETKPIDITPAETKPAEPKPAAPKKRTRTPMTTGTGSGSAKPIDPDAPM